MWSLVVPLVLVALATAQPGEAFELVRLIESLDRREGQPLPSPLTVHRFRAKDSRRDNQMESVQGRESVDLRLPGEERGGEQVPYQQLVVDDPTLLLWGHPHLVLLPMSSPGVSFCYYRWRPCKVNSPTCRNTRDKSF